MYTTAINFLYFDSIFYKRKTNTNYVMQAYVVFISNNNNYYIKRH